MPELRARQRPYRASSKAPAACGVVFVGRVGSSNDTAPYSRHQAVGLQLGSARLDPERSTVNGQRSTVNGQRSMVNGQWPMAVTDVITQERQQRAGEIPQQGRNSADTTSSSIKGDCYDVDHRLTTRLG